MADDLSNVTYEAAIEELERIVDELEQGGPDLTEAIARYGRGVALLGHCQGWLDTAERSVAMLVGVLDDGSPEVAPFDASATISTAPATIAAAPAATPPPAVEPEPEPEATPKPKSPAATKPKGRSRTPGEIPEAPF